jgi:hypothetical protein
MTFKFGALRAYCRARSQDSIAHTALATLRVSAPHGHFLFSKSLRFQENKVAPELHSNLKVITT